MRKLSQIVAAAALSLSVVGCTSVPVAVPPTPVEQGNTGVEPGVPLDPPEGEGEVVDGETGSEAPVRREIPDPFRGMLLTGWYAGSPDLLEPLLDWAQEAGINAVVLDLKAEDGKISWESRIPLAQEIGANETKIRDLPALIDQLHERGFWVAGRIVVMNDQFLYRGRPEWGIPGFPGGAYSFMDPMNENVWRYNIDIALEAVEAGVDEIQFDYIRYPEKLVEGYNKDTGPEYRTGAITGFLEQAMAELKPLGVIVSADVFGLTTSVVEGDDMEIGQDYRKIAEIVDYICPMVYPSHYAAGTYGLDNPDNYPYETVKESMTRAIERTPGIPLEKHRPWIQDFTYPAPGARQYGPAEVEAQIRALLELGINDFMLWDPSNKYSRGLDYAQLSP